MEILNKDQKPEVFLKGIVTGDETWFYHYDPEYKIQPNQDFQNYINGWNHHSQKYLDRAYALKMFTFNSIFPQTF